MMCPTLPLGGEDSQIVEYKCWNSDDYESKILIQDNLMRGTGMYGVGKHLFNENVEY